MASKFAKASFPIESNANKTRVGGRFDQRTFWPADVLTSGRFDQLFFEDVLLSQNVH